MLVLSQTNNDKCDPINVILEINNLPRLFYKPKQKHYSLKRCKYPHELFKEEHSKIMNSIIRKGDFSSLRCICLLSPAHLLYSCICTIKVLTPAQFDHSLKLISFANANREKKSHTYTWNTCSENTWLNVTELQLF